jgi:site-specific recombinase XerD
MKKPASSNFSQSNFQAGCRGFESRLPLHYSQSGKLGVPAQVNVKYNQNERYEQQVLEFMLLSKTIEYYSNSLYAERKSPKTIEVYQDNLNLFQRHIGDIKLLDINVLHARDFLAHRSKTTAAATTHQSFRVMRAFFNWCIKEGFLEQTPLKNVQAPRLDHKVIQTYNRDDIQAMLRICPQKSFLGARNRAIISLLIDTGMRESELLGLDINNIDYRSGAIKIRGKGEKERIVHINDKARQALWHYMLLRDVKCQQKETILFLSEELRPLTRTGILTIIRKIGHAAGIKKVNIHKFRHSAAIEFLRSGGNLATLQQMLGHTNVSTTMRYLTALNADDVVAAHRQFSPGDKML